MLFAYRLAAKLGIPNAELLLDSLEDHQIARWKATAVIDGWFNGWRHTAEIIAAIHSGVNREIVARAAKPEQAYRAMKWYSGHEIATNLTDFKKTKPKKKSSTELAKQFYAAKFK